MNPNNAGQEKGKPFVTRRQMLQRLGGFSVVAAGLLVLPAARATAGNMSPILPLLLDDSTSPPGPDPGSLSEGFESGDFSTYPWVQGGSAPWIIVSSDKYQGSYAARSGVVVHGSASELSITRTFAQQGYISFYRKVSSEASYDFLLFLCDEIEKARWSGVVAWSRVEYAVTAGTHTLKWKYSKDASVNGNDDCAWIDEILFTPQSSYTDWSNYSDAWSNYSDTWNNYSDYGVWAAWMQSF
jgi:hypothetical protein